MPGPTRRSEEAVRRTAAHWVALVQDPDAAVDRAAFEQWRSADPQHRIAYARAERAWDQAGLLTFSDVGGDRRLERQPWQTRRLTRMAAAAAVVLVAGIIGLMMVLRQPAAVPGPQQVADLASRVGEIRKVALADGSTLTLDTDTVVRANVGAGGGEIVLERGRMRLEMPERGKAPLLVTVGRVTMTARGAALDASFLGGSASVALLRGSAGVRGARAREGPGAATTVSRLLAGQDLAFSRNGSVSSVRSIATGQVRWTGGMLSFDRTRLADALATANRYSGAKIIVADPALNELRITGAYRAGDPRGLSAGLAASLGLRFLQTPRGDYVLMAAP